VSARAIGGVAQRLFVSAALLSLAACGGENARERARDLRYPKRPDGCEVTLYHETPIVPTENIGPVNAECSEDIAADDCLRTFKNVVCGMGGDVVWGVDEPERRDGTVFYRGRAAHTKIPRSRTPAAKP
jgi:hypothetical protein